MKTAHMHSWLLPCVLGGLALATPTFAQDEDTPDSYPDEEQPDSSPRPVEPEEDTAADFRSEEGDEENDERVSRMDDPNMGVAFEALGGAMLVSSPRGRLFGDFLPAVGGRFTWEYGRLLDSDTLRESLWFDVRYTHAGVREGTKLIVGDTRLHYVALAPAYALMFGESSDYGVYAQVGGGIAYEHTTLEVGGKVTPMDGFKPLIQYGVGLRGRTQLSSESNMRLAWRVELMRFRRGYLDDTFVGASLGSAF
jgi:hypothetical protein